MKTVEICSNCEWWHVFGPAGDIDDIDNYDSEINVMISDICLIVENLGYDAICSTGQRGMCHGWNGANTFVRKDSGVGTFDDFSDNEWDIIVGKVLDIVQRHEEIFNKNLYEAII